MTKNSMHFQPPATNPDRTCEADLSWAAGSVQPIGKSLTRLQTAFVDALLLSPTLDPAAAHLEATRRVQKKPAAQPYHAGRQLMAYPAIQEELQRRRRTIEASVDAQVVQLEVKLARIALADIRALFDPATGQPLPLHQLNNDTAAMIGSIEEEHYVRGKGEDAEHGIRRKYKPLDPLAAAKLLMARRGIAANPDGSSGSGAGIVANIQINL